MQRHCIQYDTRFDIRHVQGTQKEQRVVQNEKIRGRSRNLLIGVTEKNEVNHFISDLGAKLTFEIFSSH